MRHDPNAFAGWDHNIYGEWEDVSIDEWTSDIDEARQIADAFAKKTGRHPKTMRYPMYETPDGFIETDCINHNGEEV
jgi:hypothetical protein